MRTFSQDHFRQARELEFLHLLGKARPIGRSKANDALQWLATDTRKKVVLIGLVLKRKVRVA